MFSPKPQFAAGIYQIKDKCDHLAPDGSEMRVLTTKKDASGGDLAHCTLPPGKTSIPVKHRSVHELWYFTSGTGELWLNDGEKETTHQVKKGSAISIPAGTAFQFRNLSQNESLEIVMTTMPPWPGPDEAIKVEGKWKPSVSPNIQSKL